MRDSHASLRQIEVPELIDADDDDDHPLFCDNHVDEIDARYIVFARYNVAAHDDVFVHYADAVQHDAFVRCVAANNDVQCALQDVLDSLQNKKSYVLDHTFEWARKKNAVARSEIDYMQLALHCDHFDEQHSLSPRN